MGTLKNYMQLLHNSSKRNYKKRMMENKVSCMIIAKKYGSKYWDGNRKFGYGGYKYIPGRWETVAKKLIKDYRLDNNSKILDLGCGKGYLLFEIKKILPKIIFIGLDYSKYAILNSHPEVKKNIKFHDCKNKLKYKNNHFDLVISTGVLHNLKLHDLNLCLNEISRVGKKNYIMVESFRNDLELFNLQCWALTCEIFFDNKTWIRMIKKFKNIDYEFIYFK
jgi:SAM-dependent methyltransferase|tara:strand:+ start:3384 stop:4046 length:663 start_codon:yes stop_codon:yes gene_type:complete